jgi:hypothetical protein
MVGRLLAIAGTLVVLGLLGWLIVEVLESLARRLFNLP